MITYLAKECLDGGMNARAARQEAFTAYLTRDVPGSTVRFSGAGGSSRSPRATLKAVGRLFGGVHAVWASGNEWVVVDYPNHPASVPRRLPVFIVACAYLASLRFACALGGSRLVVQSDDDPVLQDELLAGVRLTRLQLLLERTYEKALFRSADVLWFSGNTAAESLCLEFGVPTSKVVHVPNGAPEPEAAAVAIPGDGFRFVYAGMLRPDTYGVRGLVDAFREVGDPAARLVMLGPDGEWIPRYAAERGDERVVYLGCVTPGRMQDLLARCDAGVLVGKPDGYYSSGFPGKLGAYLGAGLPVLTTCGGDPARHLAERGVGTRCTEQGLGRAMDSLVAERDSYREMQRNAVALRGDYGWDAIFSRAVQDLRTRCARRGRRDDGTERFEVAVTAGGDANGRTRGFASGDRWEDEGRRAGASDQPRIEAAHEERPLEVAYRRTAPGRLPAVAGHGGSGDADRHLEPGGSG